MTAQRSVSRLDPSARKPPRAAARISIPRALVTLALASASCFGPGVIVPPNGNDDGEPPDGNGGNPDPPEVRLTVTNPAPLPNETVVLTCSVVNDADGPFEFTFEPTFGRLIVNASTGQASFIVDASDAGIAFEFRCRASNDAGSGPASNRVIVITTAP